MTTIDAQISASFTKGVAPALKADDKWYSWQELAAFRDRLDAVLRAAGLGAGTGVAIVGRSRPSHVAALYAVIATRRAALLINPFVTDALLAQSAAEKQAAVYLADAEDWNCPLFRAEVAAQGALALSLPSHGLEVTVLADKASPAPAALEEGTALVITSSGTTGKPKATCYSFATLTDAIAGQALWARRAGEAPPDAGLSAALILYAPFVHISGQMTLLQAAAEGRPLYLLEKFNAAGWREAVREARIEMGPLPPAMLRMFLEAGYPKEDIASLKAIRSGGAALDEVTRETFQTKYGIPIMSVYGATEYGGVIAGWSLEDWHLYGKTHGHAAGRFDPLIAAGRIVDPESGADLGFDVAGVLEVQVPRLGHRNWIRTTDIASIDALGFLIIHGRADDAINRGGFKVLPDVVETALRDHPGVKDAKLVGLPDARLGQVPVAAVEHAEGHETLSGEELRKWLRDKLVAYQIPAEIRVVESLPRVTIGKISIAGVKDLFAQPPAETEV